MYLPQLELFEDVYATKRFSRRMVGMDKEMCHISFLLSDGEQMPWGGLDPTETDGQTGMPLISATVHPHSRCPHDRHDPDLPIQPTKGVPDAKPSSELWKWHHILSRICKWHYILYGGIGGEGKEPFPASKYIFRLFRPLHQPYQVSLCHIQTIAKREGPMLQGLVDANRDITHEIPRPALDNGVTYNLGLEAGNHKVKVKVKGVAGQTIVLRGRPRSDVVDSLFDS